jgi:hypothetical protein
MLDTFNINTQEVKSKDSSSKEHSISEKVNDTQKHSISLGINEK